MSNVYIQQRGAVLRPRYAIMREGRKSALKVFPDLDAAVEYALPLIQPVLMEYRLVIVKNRSGEVVRKQTKFTKVNP